MVVGGAVKFSREIKRSVEAAETGGEGDAIIVVILATKYKTIAIPDRGWHSTNS